MPGRASILACQALLGGKIDVFLSAHAPIFSALLGALPKVPFATGSEGLNSYFFAAFARGLYIDVLNNWRITITTLPWIWTSSAGTKMGPIVGLAGCKRTREPS